MLSSMRMGGMILVKDIEKKRGNVRAVAIYNPSDTACVFSVPFSILELSGKVNVRDLVQQKTEGSMSGKMVYELPPHSVKILRVEAGEASGPGAL